MTRNHQMTTRSMGSYRNRHSMALRPSKSSKSIKKLLAATKKTSLKTKLLPNTSNIHLQMKKDTFFKRFALKKCDSIETRSEGYNCGIATLMVLANAAFETEIKVNDNENVALFRRYLSFLLMKLLANDNFCHPDGDNETRNTMLFVAGTDMESIYSIDNHEDYKYGNDSYSLDAQLFLPLIAYCLQKSVFVRVVEGDEHSKKESSQAMYFQYVESKPDCLCRIFNTGENAEVKASVKQFPSTLFMTFYTSGHYEPFVPNDVLKRVSSWETSITEGHKYFVSEEDWRTAHEKLMNKQTT